MITILDSQVKVKLQDGRSFPGYVQAVDPVSDLATVRIQAVCKPQYFCFYSKFL